MSVKTIFKCNGCDATIEQTALHSATWSKLSVRDTSTKPLAIRSAEDTTASLVSRDDHACSSECLAKCVRRFADVLETAPAADVGGFKLDVMALK
jgi:hypothetical protein